METLYASSLVVPMCIHCDGAGITIMIFDRKVGKSEGHA